MTSSTRSRLRARIGQPLASQFAPAVLEYLGAAGFELERSMLARVLD